MSAALFLLVGGVAGILSGLFGIGGGIVIVVVLVSYFKMSIHEATGTSLAALLLPVGLLGVREYYKAGHIDVRAAMLIAFGLFLGVWAGARYAQGIAPATLQRGFAVFLGVMAVRMWFKA
ncbi:MAG: TSUP family transporter [Gemmatimonadales bacterium]